MNKFYPTDSPLISFIEVGDAYFKKLLYLSYSRICSSSFHFVITSKGIIFPYSPLNTLTF